MCGQGFGNRQRFAVRGPVKSADKFQRVSVSQFSLRPSESRNYVIRVCFSRVSKERNETAVRRLSGEEIRLFHW
jgi:hypothetical protein